MGNLADESGSDVEIYRKALSTTIHADTPTGAPEKLLALLDRLGLRRTTLTTAGPQYVWHEVPDDLSEAEQKRLATRAVPTLLMAGYIVNITTEVFDTAAYLEAVNAARASHTATTARAVAPPADGGRSRPRRGV